MKRACVGMLGGSRRVGSVNTKRGASASQRTRTANTRSEHSQRTLTANTHRRTLTSERPLTANTHSEHSQGTPTVNTQRGGSNAISVLLRQGGVCQDCLTQAAQAGQSCKGLCTARCRMWALKQRHRASYAMPRATLKQQISQKSAEGKRKFLCSPSHFGQSPRSLKSFAYILASPRTLRNPSGVNASVKTGAIP